MFKPEYQPTSFRDFIQKIYETRGLTALRYYIEYHRVLFDDVPEQKILIDQIWVYTNDLDYVQMLCAEYLGNRARAEELAVWINTRHERRQPPSIDEL